MRKRIDMSKKVEPIWDIVILLPFEFKPFLDINLMALRKRTTEIRSKKTLVIRKMIIQKGNRSDKI